MSTNDEGQNQHCKMTESVPVSLQKTGDRSLRITWSDGLVQLVSYRRLRDACPCATCREKNASSSKATSSLPILTEAEARPLEIQNMQPVGNYGYNIRFSDGHSTGIYSLELLRSLASND